MAPPSSYRPQIVKLNRSDLEDSYYRLFDENQALKQEIHGQHEKLKKMAAKLLKTMSGKGERDIDRDEKDNRISELDKQNALLKSKLQSAKHQLATYARRPLSPGFRPGSGLQSRQLSSRRTPVHPKTPIPEVRTPAPAPQQQTVLHVSAGGSSLANQRRLENTIGEMERKLYAYEDEIAALNDKLRLKDAELDQTNLQLKTHLTSEQRISIQENIEVIRLQQQLKTKSQELGQSSIRFVQLEKDLRTLKNQHDALLAEFDQVNTRLRTEQNLNSQLQSQIQSYHVTQGSSSLQNTQDLENLRRENQVLKETHEKLISNAFNSDRENAWMQTERNLRARIGELENAVRADVNTRNEILEKLASEMGAREKAEDEFRKYEVQHLQLKAENERLDRKLKSLTSGDLSWSDVEEALALIRQKKELSADLKISKPDFIQSIPIEDKQQQDVADQLERLKVLYAEAVQELEKTRNMLLVQHKINTDYQSEVDVLNRRTEQHKMDFEKQLKTYSELLDQRALRIQRLESYLHDLAYGRRPYKTGIEISTEKTPMPQLEPGQNLLEITLTKVNLSADALRWMQASEPSIFLTVEFFDFEIQFTPVMKGPNASMDFVCEYTVMASDLFLHYLENDSATVEVHQAIGTNYKTWSSCAVFLRDLLKTADGKIFGSATLTAIASEAIGLEFGQLDFTIQLKVPIEKSLALYKERAQALGYLLGDKAQETDMTLNMEQTNQLLVVVHRCNNLKPRHPDIKYPSAYVMYKVFDFADHDTKVISNTAKPEFSDQRIWTLPIGSELDSYLRSQMLRFLVFDDAAPSDDLSYLGHVDIPLLPLSHNKPIIGTFQLQSETGDDRGTIDLSVSWKFVYIPPKHELLVSKPMVDLEPEKEISKPTDTEPLSPVSQGPRTIRMQAEQKPVIPKPAVPPRIHAKTTDVIAVSERIDDIPKIDEQKMRETQEELPALVRQGSYTVIPATGAPSAPQLRKESSSSSSETPPDIGTLVQPPPPPYSAKLPEVGLKKSSIPPLEPIVRIASQGSKEDQKPGDLPPIAAPRKPKVVEIIEKPTQIFEREPSSPEQSDEIEKEQEIHEVVVRLKIGGFWLPEDSPLLEDAYDDTKIFVQWDFLDLEEEDCQTDMSIHLPRIPSEQVDFESTKDIGLSERRLDLLKSTLKADTRINFELLTDPEDEDLECEELGKAELKLLAAWQSQTDTSDHIVKFVNNEGQTIAFQRIALANLDSLKSQLGM